MNTSSAPHSSSGGHAYAGVEWLDARYESNRVEYEAQVREVGYRPGWHVLDAGCGSGAFLPLLAELVGPTGQLTAVDVASENIATVNDRLIGWGLGGRMKTAVGSVVALPFADATFDAVWCANTSQYLTDTELRVALAELIRVVRPGGLVAVKESDATLFRVLPAPVGIMLRAYVAGAQSGGIVERGMIRAAELPGLVPPRRLGAHPTLHDTPRALHATHRLSTTAVGEPVQSHCGAHRRRRRTRRGPGVLDLAPTDRGP